MRKPRDVSLEDFEVMKRLIPQGCVFKKSYVSRKLPYWRTFRFVVEGKPKRLSRLKTGDVFETSVVRIGAS